MKITREKFKITSKWMLCLAIIAVALLGSCTKQGSGTENAAVNVKQTKDVVWEDGIDKPQNEWFVGVVLPQFNHAFFGSMITACEDAGKKYDFKVDIRDGQQDVAKQIAIIEEFIVMKVDAILLCPETTDALVSAVKKANAANIPVVLLNREAGEGAEYVTFVGPDNVAGGRAQGEMMVKALGGKGNVIILQGSLGSSSQQDREKGFEEAIAAYPDIKIVAKYPCDWDRAKALAATQDALVRFEKGTLNGIVSQDSEMNMAAVQALKAAGRTELLGKIVNFDFPSYSKEGILDGDLYGAVVQDPYQEAMIAMDQVWLYLSGHGENIPRPQMYTPLPKVTKENAELFPASW